MHYLYNMIIKFLEAAMKKIMTFILVICTFCIIGIYEDLLAQPSEMLTYGNNWKQDMKWGLIRQIEVDKDQDRIDVDNLDVLKDGAYFMVFIPNNPTAEEVQWRFGPCALLYFLS